MPAADRFPPKLERLGTCLLALCTPFVESTPRVVSSYRSLSMRGFRYEGIGTDSPENSSTSLGPT